MKISEKATDPIKVTSKEFEEILKGNKLPDKLFFENIWVNFTTFAYREDSKPLIRNILKWGKDNAKEHAGFMEHMYLTVGCLDFLSDNFEASKKYLTKAEDLFLLKNNEEGVAACHIYLGYLYSSVGDLERALKYGLNGIDKLAHTKDYKFFVIIGSYWLGNVYVNNGHLNEALIFFKTGLDVDYPKGIRFMGARLTNGLAGVYMKQKNYKLALEYYHKALDLSNSTTENTFKARGLTDLGDYYFEMGDYEQAIKYNHEALNIRQDRNILNGTITNYMNLGEIYIKQKKFEEALNVLNQSLKIAEAIHVKAKIYNIHQMLSEAYQSLGKFEESLKHHKAFHEIYDQVNHEDMEHKLKIQQELFKAEQTRKENVIITAQKKEIETEKQRSDELLKNILPEEVAEELMNKGSAEAKLFDSVTVLFTDFKNFTGISEKMTATELVEEIHTCFKAFDLIMDKHHLEKIKTIGDSYMCAGGLPKANSTHAENAVMAGLEIKKIIDERMQQRISEGLDPFQIRIGIHTGPVVAGIVGIKKFAYDIWGDTVNTASRMESSGEAGKVNISRTTYELVKDKFNCQYRGRVQAKGKGEMDMYFVEGIVKA